MWKTQPPNNWLEDLKKYRIIESRDIFNKVVNFSSILHTFHKSAILKQESDHNTTTLDHKNDIFYQHPITGNYSF